MKKLVLLFTLALLFSFVSFGQTAKEYNKRGVSKNQLRDYYGAIADYTKAIELDPNYANAYKNRGISKENLGDLNNACADWKKAAELGVTDAAEWVAKQCN